MKKVITGCCLLFSFLTLAEESFNGETKLPQVIENKSELLIQVSEEYEQDSTESELLSSIVERNQETKNIIIKKN